MEIINNCRPGGHNECNDFSAERRKQLNILVVDDEEPTVELLTETFRHHGLKVFPASSGTEAMEIFRARSVDVIVSDLAMPSVDGMRLSRMVGEDCHRRKKHRPPFILLTGLGGQVDREALLREGVDAVLEKPVSVFELLALVREVASGRTADMRNV